MPLVLSVSQLLETSNGAVPEAFKAKIKIVKKVFEGTNGHGPYKLQTIVITDGVKEMDCVFSKRETVDQSAVGRQFYAEAQRGDKGLHGLMRKTGGAKYGSKPEIHVTAAAVVTFDGDPAQQQPPAQTPPPQRQANGNGSHAPTNGNGHPPANQAAQPPAGGIVDKHAAREATMRQCKIRVGRTASALNLCFDAAISVVDDVNGRHNGIMGKPSPELLEKIAMGIMVNAFWNEKPGAVDTFPTRPFQYYEKPPQQSAPPQRQGTPFET